MRHSALPMQIEPRLANPLHQTTLPVQNSSLPRKSIAFPGSSIPLPTRTMLYFSVANSHNMSGPRRRFSSLCNSSAFLFISLRILSVSRLSTALPLPGWAKHFHRHAYPCHDRALPFPSVVFLCFPIAMLVPSHVPLFLRAAVLILRQTTHRSANALPCLSLLGISVASAAQLHTYPWHCIHQPSCAVSSHRRSSLRTSMAQPCSAIPLLRISSQSSAFAVPLTALPLPRISQRIHCVSVLRSDLPYHCVVSLAFTFPPLCTALHIHAYLRLTKPWLR